MPIINAFFHPSPWNRPSRPESLRMLKMDAQMELRISIN